MKHEMDFGTLTFYLDEYEYSEWLKDAIDGGVDIKIIDGDGPLQFPCLVVVSVTYIDNRATEADVYFAYPEDLIEAGGPKSGTDRILLNSEAELKSWRSGMAEEDVLVSTAVDDEPLRYPCLMLSRERVSNAGNVVAEVMFVYPEDFSND